MPARSITVSNRGGRQSEHCREELIQMSSLFTASMVMGTKSWVRARVRRDKGPKAQEEILLPPMLFNRMLSKINLNVN